VAERSLDRVALAFGVAFILVGALFLLDRLDVWRLRAAHVLPVVLIALGLGVLLGARSKGSRSAEPPPSEPPAPPA